MTSEGGEKNYNIFRWYRAGWGRYTQSDPAGFKGGLNLFAYARENPLTWIDPYGLATKQCKKCDDCPEGKWSGDWTPIIR